jgi:hypothetical protein
LCKEGRANGNNQPKHRIWLAGMGLGLVVGLTSCFSGSSTSGNVTSNQNPSQTAVNLNNSSKLGLTEQLERAIAQDLPQEIGVPIQSVTCPHQEKLEAGKTFNCTAKISPGTFPVEVTVKNPNGQITLKTKQILILTEAEKLLQQSIQQRTGTTVQADCGGKVKLFQKVGEKFQCKLATASGKKGTATITVTKSEGKVDATWKL